MYPVIAQTDAVPSGAGVSAAASDLLESATIDMNSSPVMVSFSYRYAARRSSSLRFSPSSLRAFSCWLADSLDYALVDTLLCVRRAGKGSVASEVLIAYRLHRHHVKIVTHTVSGYHSAGYLGRLLYIVRGTGGYLSEYNLLGGSASGERSYLVFELLSGHQHLVVLLYLHGVAERAGGARNDCNFLNGSGVGLERGNECMTYLVIGYDLFLTVGHYGIFLLIAGDNDLDAFLKISLTYGGTVIADRTERCLVYNVGKLCARWCPQPCVQ